MATDSNSIVPSWRNVNVRSTSNQISILLSTKTARQEKPFSKQLIVPQYNANDAHAQQIYGVCPLLSLLSFQFF